MIKWIKEFSGWNDLNEEIQHEKKCLVGAYFGGFITALVIVSLLKGGL